MNSSQSAFDVSISYTKENHDILLKFDEIFLKQKALEEKLNRIENNIVTHDSIDSYKKRLEQYQLIFTFMNNLDEFEDKLAFFRIFIWRFCFDVHNWKSLAHSVYHIEYLINHIDNYRIKGYLQKYFQNLLKSFILFVKDLITTQIKSPIHQTQVQIVDENDSLKTNNRQASHFPLKNSNSQIEEHIENIKNDINTLKQSISTVREHFNICRTDTEAIEILLKAIANINFDSINFDKKDHDNIHLIKLKEDLSKKSNKTDLMQLKVLFDNQLKQIIELNKQNALELERIKLMKTAKCESHHVQKFLSNNSYDNKHFRRMCSFQSSRPYITFELDDIRKYQRQALLKSPYGTIPLYRRQAWAAANQSNDHSLQLLRYTQNSLRMQVHCLLGYDPSDIWMLKKEKKINKNRNIEIVNTSQDISIVGNNNKLYRGSIDACQINPIKTSKGKKPKIKSHMNENHELVKHNIDQLNQTNKTIAHEHLFEYFDWENKFHEQDLPDELCEELFQHWKSIISEDEPYICNSKSNLILHQEDNHLEQNIINTQIDLSSKSSLRELYDNCCICRDCSCDCEKYQSDESICICSQCSCQCLKDFQSENQNNIDDLTKDNEDKVSLLQQDTNLDDISINQLNINEQPTIINVDKVSSIEQIQQYNEEVIICNCFANQADQWSQQFDIFQNIPKPTVMSEGKDCSIVNDRSYFQNAYSAASQLDIILNPLELDDPTLFRQKTLNNNHQQHQQF